MKKKTVGIIGTNGLPGKYGGWDQLVIHLTKNLKEKYNFIVYTSYSEATPGLKEYNGAKIKIVRFRANGFQSIPFDIMSIIHALRHCEVLFICGTSGCISMPIAKIFGKNIVLNPDGQEWKRDKWSRPIQMFLRLSEKFGVKYSTNVVADNAKIQEYINEAYCKKSHLIEYGGDHVSKVSLSNKTAVKYGIEEGNYAFKVCRIVPENNIDLILGAFSKMPDLNLILIGNWDNSEFGKTIRKKYSNFFNLKLLNPVYDQTTLDELRSNCGIYVHGHSVGGTNPSLVEAMNLGLLIASYDVDYNIETTEGKALYFRDETELMEIIDNFLNKKIDLTGYQRNMKEIAERRYKWEIITNKYAFVFNL